MCLRRLSNINTQIVTPVLEFLCGIGCDEMYKGFDKEEIQSQHFYYDDLIEVDGYFYSYKNINYMVCVKSICNNLKQIYLLNLEKDKLYADTDFLRGLLKLVTEHKKIYEDPLIKIYDGFKEQAGSYEHVIKSFNYYKERYENEYEKPKKILNEKISQFIGQIEEWQKESDLKIEPVFNMTGKTKYYMCN